MWNFRFSISESTLLPAFLDAFQISHGDSVMIPIHRFFRDDQSIKVDDPTFANREFQLHRMFGDFFKTTNAFYVTEAVEDAKSVFKYKFFKLAHDAGVNSSGKSVCGR
jgi:hypothetical protein